MWSSRCGLTPGQYLARFVFRSPPPPANSTNGTRLPETRDTPSGPERDDSTEFASEPTENPPRGRSGRVAHPAVPTSPGLGALCFPPPTSTPRSRSSHHSVNSCSAPPSLSVLFLLPMPGVEWRAGLKMPAGTTPLRPRPNPTPGLPRSLRVTGHRARPPADGRPSDRSTDPARRDQEELARAYTSPARSGANVGTSAPSCPTPPACARRRPASRPQSSEWDPA